MALDLKSPVCVGKIVILVLGIAVLGLGLYSHFQSSWRKHSLPLFLDPSGSGKIKAFKICGLKNRDPLWKDEACPAIEMEEFFVSMIIICFVLSLINLISSIFLDFQSGVLKLFDLGFHGVSGILLLIAGIVYIISAIQINKLVYKDAYVKYMLNVLEYNFRRDEKLVAGVATMIHSLIYTVVAGMIFKSERSYSF